MLFRRAALACYAVAAVLAVLAFAWWPSGWLAAAVLLAGLWCQRGVMFARRLEDDAPEVVDVPGD